MMKFYLCKLTLVLHVDLVNDIYFPMRSNQASRACIKLIVLVCFVHIENIAASKF